MLQDKHKPLAEWDIKTFKLIVIAYHKPGTE